MAGAMMEGVVRACLQHYAATQRAAGAPRLAAPDGDGFPQRMHRLAAAGGYQVHEIEARDAAFLMPAAGTPYGFSLHLRGETVHVFFYSNVAFPPGRAPADLVRYLSDERNPALTGFGWEVQNAAKHSCFVLRSGFPYAAFDLHPLVAALAEHAEEVKVLDGVLARLGFTR
jgi:hypothetical protein